MPTPQAFDQLWTEHQELRRAVFEYLTATTDVDDAREALWELVGDYEPSETQQGLIPIPDAYAEQ